MEYILETFELTKRFPRTKGFIDILTRSRNNEVSAIEDINLKVKKNEFFGIVGPNGAGKTTLIKILCTLILPTSGSACVNGYDIVKEDDKARECLGFVSGDERSFYWRLTGRQNLEFFASLANLRDPNKKVCEVLELVDLKDKADDKFQTYSAGMKQRMAIARGMLNDPEVLFMDEPTRSIDPFSAEKLRSFIKEELVKEQGKTIFMSTHLLDEAEKLCDRIAIIDKGRIRACGTLNDLEKQIPPNEICNLEIKGISKDILTKLSDMEGISEISTYFSSDIAYVEIQLSNRETLLPQIIERIVNNGGKIRECNLKKPDLNEIFMNLVDKRG